MRIAVENRNGTSTPGSASSVGKAVTNETTARRTPGSVRSRGGVLATLASIARSRPLLTVSVDQDAVRTVLFKKGVPVAWHTRHVAGGTPASEDLEVAINALRHPGVRRARVVSDLPITTTSVRSISVPAVKKKDLTEVLFSIVLESLPFEEDEVDLAWRTAKKEDGLQSAVTVTPKTAIDQRFTELTVAGARPRGAYSRAAALAIAGGRPDATIVWAGRDSAEMVMVRGGFPCTAHEMRWPSEDPAARAEMVSKTVFQAEGYAQMLDGAEMASKGASIVLVGPLARDAALTGALRRSFGREVFVPETPARWPRAFPPYEYAVNVGIARAHIASGKSSSAIEPGLSSAVNLLSRRHMPQGVSPTRLAMAGVLILFAADAYALSVVVDSATVRRDARVAEAAKETKLAQESRVRQQQLAAAEQLAREVSAEAGTLESRLALFEGGFATLMSQYGLVTGGAVPAGTTISSFSIMANNFLIGGVAPEYQDVLQLTANLSASGLFDSVKITQAGRYSPGAGSLAQPKVSFQIKAVVPAPGTGGTAR